MAEIVNHTLPGSVEMGVLGTMTTTNPPPFDSESEEALALRYGGLTSKQPDDLVFEFTLDPGLLHQYYRLCEKEFWTNTDQRLPLNESEHNHKTHILVARRGNLCVGGARISIRTPRLIQRLPLEIGDFRIESHFPQLTQNEMRYGELSQLILLEEFRDANTLSKIFHHIYRKSVALNLVELFSSAPLSNILLYKKNFALMGLREAEIHFDIKLPVYPAYQDTKNYLLRIVIHKTDEPDDGQDVHNNTAAYYKSINKHLPTDSADIRYEMHFTRNNTLINEYKKLRKRLYGIDPRFIGFRMYNDDAAEDYEDPDDQMLIMHDGNQCYGGACLRISTPKHPVILDLEMDILPPAGEPYFALRKYLKEMQLDKYAYSEFNRIVIDPRLRKGEAARRMFHAMLERCLENNVRYMFGIGDKVRTRLYRQIYNNIGMDCRIRDEVDIPMREEYEGMKMLLLGGDMKKFYITPETPDAESLLQPLNEFEFY